MALLFVAGKDIAYHWYSGAKTYNYNAAEGDPGNFIKPAISAVVAG